MEDKKEDWELVKRVNTKIVFLHAYSTDQLDLKYIEKFSKRCRKEGLIPGVATHNGGHTIPVIDKSSVDVQVYLCPFNVTGLHVHPSLKETLNAIKNTPKKVVGMKVLSCGNVPPLQAFEFALPYVDAVAVGMTDKKEIDENCYTFEKVHHILGTKRNSNCKEKPF